MKLYVYKNACNDEVPWTFDWRAEPNWIGNRWKYIGPEKADPNEEEYEIATGQLVRLLTGLAAEEMRDDLLAEFNIEHFNNSIVWNHTGVHLLRISLRYGREEEKKKEEESKKIAMCWASEWKSASEVLGAFETEHGRPMTMVEHAIYFLLSRAAKEDA